MRLFHFINASYGLAAIRDQRYKLSTFDNLNDPFELFASDLSDPVFRPVFRTIKDKLAVRLALLCTSKSWRSTLLWSHYADRHRGMALELEVDEKAIVHVVYSKDRLPVTVEMIQNNANADPGKTIGDRMNIKSSDWAYEDEARVMFNLDGIPPPSDSLYFVPFDDRVALKGVILGPLSTTSNDQIQAAIPAGKTLTVTRSRIAFGSFQVVRNMSIKREQLTGSARLS